MTEQLDGPAREGDGRHPSPSCAPKVFVGYRSDDAPDAAHRLAERLESRFGESSVFLDIDRISPGAVYAKVISDWVGKTDVFVAVIGRGWLGEKSDGSLRIKEPRDFVRRELQTALSKGVPVIPVLIEDAPILRAQDLPKSLAQLSDLEAIRLTRSHWAADVERLQSAITELAGGGPDEATQPPGGRRPFRKSGRRLLTAAVVIAVAVVAVVVAAAGGKPSGRSRSSTVGPGSTSAPPPADAARSSKPASGSSTSASQGHQPISSARGPSEVVGQYWTDIENGNFAAAYKLFDNGYKEHEAERNFIKRHEAQAIRGARFVGSSSFGPGAKAQVSVALLLTEDALRGCWLWKGHYAMEHSSGRWLIDEAIVRHKKECAH